MQFGYSRPTLHNMLKEIKRNGEKLVTSIWTSTICWWWDRGGRAHVTHSARGGVKVSFYDVQWVNLYRESKKTKITFE